MRAATLFSGIGAPEQAMPGWQWLWHADIEPFPAAVMAARHPDSINLGDVLADDFAERAERAGRPDVLVFGSPCQSFSVAGKRLGLSDPRGNLALVALALVRRLRPDWFVFENVPGLLSSEGGDDFETFLGAVAESGYTGCWRVLDARYWNLAQRRERVFFVGSLGDWRGPAAVLSFAEGMRGYPEKGREKRQRVAATLDASLGRRCGQPNDDDQSADNLIAAEIAPPVTSNPYSDHESREGLLVAHALRAEGFDAGEDGTGRGTPLVPVTAPTLNAGDKKYGLCPDTVGSLIAYGGNNTSGPIDVATAVSAHGGPCGRMDFESETFVAQAFDARQSDVIQYGDMTGTLDTDGHTIAVAFHENGRAELTLNDTAGSLNVSGGKPGQGYPAALHGMQVRRLTPRECERLQGFPDDFTAISWRGKPAADGPRYRAIGNSMAVPVMSWILHRIQAATIAMRDAA